MRIDERLLEDADWAKKHGYAPFWVKDILAAKGRGEEVDTDGLRQAELIMRAVIKLRKFQRAGGESFYCPRSQDFRLVVRSYMDLVINGRTHRGTTPDLSVPKTRALFLKGLQEVETRWAAEYAAQEGVSTDQLRAPKAHGNRNRNRNRNRNTRRRASA